MGCLLPVASQAAREGKGVSESLRRRNEEARAARPIDHGHDEHAPYFDGVIEDCPGCERMRQAAVASVRDVKRHGKVEE